MQHTPSPISPARTHGETWTARDFADALCVWRLCGRAGCLRARACRGDGEDCIARCLALLPDDVQGWFEARYECEREGASWQDVLTVEEQNAFDAWQVAVRRSRFGAGRR